MGQKKNPLIYMNTPEFYDIARSTKRGLLYEVHIADIHFGAMDPIKEYQILYDQFILKISTLPRIDIIAINGDIFDRKMMANSPAIYYAIKFVSDVIAVAKMHRAAVIMTVGAPSHEAGQYNVLYQFLNDPDVEVYIVDQLKYVYTHGAKILCIPELHNEEEAIYAQYLNGELYDQAFGHMTFKGAVYGNNVGTGRLFCIEDFLKSRGPVISGHVHTPGCFEKDFYYTGSPMRYKFGEEEAKGFLIVLMDLDTRRYYTHFEEITSFRYDTIELKDIISTDPKVVIEYINDLKSKGIDYLKIKFKYIIDGSSKTIITNYYRNRNDIKLEFYDTQEEALEKAKLEQEEQSEKYSFLTDPKISDQERFVSYVNMQEGYDFISVSKLLTILSDDY